MGQMLLLKSFAALCVVTIVVVSGDSDPTDYVITTIGGDNRFEISHGNTLPIVGTPWGHSYWVPEVTHNNDQSMWWFNMRSPKLVGIRCTHQPSPWINDWGYFRLLFGYKGNAAPDHSGGYDPRKATWKPWLWETEVVGMDQRSGRGSVAITANHASSFMRVKFPPNDPTNGLDQTRRLAFERWNQMHYDNSTWEVDCAYGDDDDKTLVTGMTDARVPQEGVSDDTRFYLRFSIEIDAPCTGQSLIWDPEVEKVTGDIQALDFATTVDELNARIGVSLISLPQAVLNRAALNGKTFDEVVAVHKQVWKDQLEVVEVVDTGFPEAQEDEQLTIFYSMLYRASLFPRNIGEMDADDKEFHRSPLLAKCTGTECDDENYDIKPGPLSTDSGFWDAYHTIYDIQQLLWPDQLNTTLCGYLNAYKEDGWIPQWSSPGYRTSMDGTMSDVSFADSMLKGFIADTDPDGTPWRTTALKAMLAHAFTEPEKPEDVKQIGRRGLKDFREKHYIPYLSTDNFGGIPGETSQTLLHAFADSAIVLAAKQFDSANEIFTADQVTELDARKFYWKNVFDDKTTKHMRPRTADAGETPTWADEGVFDEFLWGAWLTEGGPYRYRFMAPHDVEGMIAAHGGVEQMCASVIAVNEAPKMYHRYFGGDHYIGAEMNNIMRLTWGQNGHCNQPSHHFQYMAIAAMEYVDDEDLASMYTKCVEPTQHWLRYTLKHCYNTIQYCGDEDNGELSAWYLFTALGFYDMAPSALKYRLGIPLFKEVKIKSDTLELTVKGVNNCPTCEKATSVKLDETALPKWFVTWEQLTAAGASTLEFTFETPPA